MGKVTGILRKVDIPIRVFFLLPSRVHACLVVEPVATHLLVIPTEDQHKYLYTCPFLLTKIAMPIIPKPRSRNSSPSMATGLST